MADNGEVEFPILCETCLGENPYVRMTREPRGQECKICTRAFTVFRWLPGRGMRYKKTEICPTCAKLKNVCQTCILDLEYGLPVQVRDAMLGQQDTVPVQASNRRDYVAKLENSVNAGLIDFSGKAQPAARQQLRHMARSEPYYKRNRAHVCSFFVKGQCNRGNECPYRHEMPDSDSELARQNISDRYHGSNDPVARRMLDRTAKRTDRLAPPTDKSITSLFATNLPENITQKDLHQHFAAFGELKSVIMVPKNSCAFINFKSRAGAETAAQAAQDTGCIVNGSPLKLTWGKSKPKGPASELAQKSKNTAAVPPPGSQTSSDLYPSQDPTAQGSSVK
ncbi:Pre-mRNA-splicing factor slt11 [Coemansia brasiliensis]|uniref:Pre-mRNA-splicing factor SLT11 n=1 Tax=Coemansia brasiliensis TaxID=2650707 RepID=A0A9W8LZU4_9FUNG|nr:Pre-mRNA-splicing factor slt11 [Coemansia brasiliensis]